MGQAISKGVLAVLVASVLLQSSVALKGGGRRLGNFVQPSRNFVPHSRAGQSYGSYGSYGDDCVMCDEMDPNFVQPSRNFVHRSRAVQSNVDDCVMCDEMGDLDPMEETWRWKRREEKRRREEEKNKMELQEAKQSFLHPEDLVSTWTSQFQYHIKIVTFLSMLVGTLPVLFCCYPHHYHLLPSPRRVSRIASSASFSNQEGRPSWTNSVSRTVWR